MHIRLKIKTLLNILYIILILISFLVVPYHNIRTGYTNWGISGFLGAKGPINDGALAVQRALTFALILFYLYNVRIQRRMRDETREIDLAIQEVEDRRHHVEREYYKLRRQMQNIYDAMNDLIIICSKSFTIEFMNKSAKSVFGEGRGKKCYEFLFDHHNPCPWCFSKRVIEGGETIIWEHRHEINGRIYRIYYSPFTNPDGSTAMVFVYHDITTEKAVEEKLATSDQYFRDLFEHLPSASLGYDRDAKIIAWNSAATKLYGFTKEEVMGRSIFDTIADKRDYDKTMDYIRGVFDGKSYEGLEWKDKRADGTTRYVYTNTYPMYDIHGKIVMGISANIDITALKAIENELRNSKEHLEKIMETPNSLIVELDPFLNIKMFNKGCEEASGYSREEVMGKNWLDIFIPERLKETVRVVFEEVKKGSSILPRHFENPLLTKSGEERVIFWSNTTVKDSEGTITSIIAMGKDITDRKRAQQRSIEAQEKTKTFLENVPLHVGVIDASGKFIVWNKYSEEMFGYKRQEVIGRLAPSDLHETPREAQEVVEVAAARGIFDKELNLIHKDGHKIPVRLVVVPMKSNNTIIGFCGFAEDISSRKSAEEELLAAKKQLENSSLKDDLTGLYNNRYVIERLNAEFERARRSFSSLSILLLDLDYFKSINDKYGREFGDTILVQVAKFLKSELRTNDIIARWEGEEFIIILPEVSHQEAIIIAQKIHRSFCAKGFGDQQHPIALACSMGVVSYPENPLFNPQEMCDAAEQTVLKVKGLGGNGVASYRYGPLKEEGSVSTPEKERLLEALRKKMLYFNIRGEDSILEAIHSLSKTVELKDHTTRKHADKVVHYAIKLAQKFNMDEHQIEDIRRAAILHDIGKLGIPDHILLKKGPLTKEEFVIVKQHPKIAAELMSAAEFLKNSTPFVLHHHEWYNGSGYPDGLKGQAIPLGARIISVVDVYDAITSDRPYHGALTKKEAIKEIQGGSGTQFDPVVVEKFLELIKNEESEP